jgi:hypothetical protein
MNKLEEALKKIESRIIELQAERALLKPQLNEPYAGSKNVRYVESEKRIIQLLEKAESIRNQLNPALVIEQPIRRRGRKPLNAE